MDRDFDGHFRLPNDGAVKALCSWAVLPDIPLIQARLQNVSTVRRIWNGRGKISGKNYVAALSAWCIAVLPVPVLLWKTAKTTLL